jgi:hypothetical protein
MGRPRIGEAVMTPAERQRRRRAKLAEIVRAEQVVAELERAYTRAGDEQRAIRAGVKRLLARWQRDSATMRSRKRRGKGRR